MQGKGRPGKYTKKRLQKSIERYFDSISRTVKAEDEDGNPLLNDKGEAIAYRQYVLPPSISGLCLHLGIDRRTWQNYGDERLHPELADTVADARARIEVYLEEQLLTREKGVQGIIFNLQNNYGWRQKQEVELGKETREQLAEKPMSVEEKIAYLRAMELPEEIEDRRYEIGDRGPGEAGENADDGQA